MDLNGVLSVLEIGTCHRHLDCYVIFQLVVLHKVEIEDLIVEAWEGNFTFWDIYFLVDSIHVAILVSNDRPYSESHSDFILRCHVVVDFASVLE